MTVRGTEFHIGGQLHVAQNIPGAIPDPISPIVLGGGAGLPPINGTAWIEGPALVGTPLSYPTPRAPMATLMLGRSTNKTAPWPTVPSILKVTTLGSGGPTPVDILFGDPGAGEVGITINSLLISIFNKKTVSIISPFTTGVGKLTWVGKVTLVGKVTITGKLIQTGASVFNGKGVRNGKETINGKLTVGGKASIAGKLSVAGPISSPTIVALKAKISTKKGFDIPHPSKSDHRLRYICVEGPAAEVYLRGKLENNNVIQLPDYWRDLVDVETIGVTLTPIGVYQELFVEKIEWGSRIIVKNNLSGPINCTFIVFAERKDTPKNIPEYHGLTPADYPGDNNEYTINGN